jgi:hypothetical protein
MSNSEPTEKVVDAQASKAIKALAEVDITELSYVKLRRLNAALIQACEKLKQESASRSENTIAGDTVRVPSPRFDAPR